MTKSARQRTLSPTANLDNPFEEVDLIQSGKCETRFNVIPVKQYLSRNIR